MPSFCRHNRLLQNCPICAREQRVELRPVLSPGGAGRAAGPAGGRSGAARPPRPRSGADESRPGGARGVRVRRLERGADDGYRSELAPGLRSSADAERLADELAWAAARLTALAQQPPGLYAELADVSKDLEERTWLAMLIAYLGPLEDELPFAAIGAVRVPWSAGLVPPLDDVAVGPRSAHAPGRGTRTLDAYRAWAVRSGSQAAALSGDGGWSAERRFARALERLATLPGFDRGARFDLLATLGAAGVYELRAGALGLGGSDPVTLGAKRLLGIGDPWLLERRALAVATASGVPLEALDVGFFNWERGQRARLGMPAELEADGATREAVRAALGL